ncbi:hypothetical protein ACTS93_02600 [Empedobacter falsenii]
MQNTSKVQQGQSFIDKTLELTGSVESLLDMAILNNVSITDDVSIGTEILGSPIVKQTIVGQIINQNIATKLTKTIDLSVPQELGIGKMKIGSTFKVK